MTMQSINMPSIQSLKQQAKNLANKDKIALNQALNLIANDYGFTHWSLLMKHFNMVRLNNPETIWHSLYPGEMMLISAAEGAGKLSMALNLACIALQENIKVHYLTIPNNRKLVYERLKMIINKVDVDFAISNDFKINDTELNEKSIMHQLNQIENNSAVIIDYLQAIENQQTGYEIFLHNIKEIAKKRDLRLLILSQVTKEGNIQLLNHMRDSKQIFRHFSHHLHLNHTDDQNNERELFLIKSTHYQCHETVLSLDKKTFLFSTANTNSKSDNRRSASARI